MPGPLADPIWENKYQRFGFINVNVMIGQPAAFAAGDEDLFFGPIPVNEHVIFMDGHEKMNLAQLLAFLGIFESVKDADRSGFRKPIPEGFSDWMRIKKMHRVSILKITKLPAADEYDFIHASQEALCEKCGVRLGSHPMAEEIIGYQDLPFLNRDCYGRLYKL